MYDSTVFNYPECLAIVGNDEEFLEEVALDFLEELEIVQKDFKKWNKTHAINLGSISSRLKGSSGHLGFKEMYDIGVRLDNHFWAYFVWGKIDRLSQEEQKAAYEEVLEIEMEFMVARDRVVEELKKYNIYKGKKIGGEEKRREQEDDVEEEEEEEEMEEEVFEEEMKEEKKENEKGED